MTTPALGDPVVVGLGMVAALGTDVLTNCAAARAGISRSSALQQFGLRSEVEGTPEAVIGHQADLITRGFEGESRLARLAHGALADLMTQFVDTDWRQHQHQFYLSLPDARRLRTGLDLIPDETVRQARLDEEAQRQQVEREAGAPSVEEAQPAQARRILRTALSAAGWPVTIENPRVSFAGHAGGLEAVRAAVADLSSGLIDTAVVLGVDSFLDEATLEWLHLCGRLKCDGVPAGVQPSEAGVAVALRSRSSGSAARPLARVGPVSASREKRTFLAGASPTGVTLAQVVGACWNARQGSTPWIISDHNGEVYRATDWGHALVRLRAQFDAFDTPVFWHPASSFGDTGAASALVAICIAVRAWERNYAPAATVIIAAASDDDGRAACVLDTVRVH